MVESEPAKLAPGKIPDPSDPGFDHALQNLSVTILATCSRARNAAKRLLDARDPAMPSPKTREQVLDLIDYMVKTPGKWGITIMPWERQALRVWGRFMRALWAREKGKEPA